MPAPFTSYVPPGVFTQTFTDQAVGQLLGGLRIPVFIGVGKETLPQTDLELIRGSSASVDQRRVNEDVSERFVLSESPLTLGPANGTAAKFQTRFFPIVDGLGNGTTTNKTVDVIVTVNGEVQVVNQVQGANGFVTLQLPPSPGDEVLVTYFFNRTDTLITDDLSDQVSDGLAELFGSEPESYDIISGVNDSFSLTVDEGLEQTVTLTAGVGRTAAQIATDITNALISGLTATTDVDNEGNTRLLLQSAQDILIGAGTANGTLGFTTSQTSGRNAVFTTWQRPIVDGTNGGITTTDVTDVTVLVNNIQVVPTAVDGRHGRVTLPVAPEDGATVLVTYYFNNWEDTFDFLPNTGIVDVLSCGVSPGRNDYIEGESFVIQDDRILWGTAVSVTAGEHTPGTTVFDDTQILPQLVDYRVYAQETERFVDTSVNPSAVSNTVFVLEEVPTTGNGRDTPLGQSEFNTVSNDRIDQPTNRPDLVTAYAGKNLRDALAKGEVEVLEVDYMTRQITLKDPVPADYSVFATYWYNLLVDSQYTLQVLTAGPSGSGTYTVRQSSTGLLREQVRFGTKSAGLATITVEFPSGSETLHDGIHVSPGTPVDETVTVTFADLVATPARFTNQDPGPYDLFAGSSDLINMSVDGVTLGTIDLDTAAPATLVGDEEDTSGAGITITPGTNDGFEFSVDGSAMIPVTLTAGAGKTMVDFAADIQAAVPAVFYQLEGSGTAPYTITLGVNDIAAVVTSVGVHTTGPIAPATYATPAAMATAINAATFAPPLPPGVTVTDNGTNVVLDVSAAAPAEFAEVGPGTINGTVGWNLGERITQEPIAYFRADTTAISRLVLRSPTTPTGPDSLSQVNIGTGNANSTLGLSPGQVANGTISATNKAATMVGNITNFSGGFPSGSNLFNYNIDGSDYQTDLAGATDIVAIVTAINATTGGSQATNDGGRLRLTSATDGANSRITIGSGNASTLLGFVAGDSASQTKATANEIATVLNNDVGPTGTFAAPDPATFAISAIAYPVTVAGVGTLLSMNSLTTGATSSIAFATSTAFNDTGIGIWAGDGDSGEATGSGYTVTSSNSQGSGSGADNTRVVGQSYSDDVTGLRFTVLPRPGGALYPAAEYFTFVISSTFITDSAVPHNAIPGVETSVFNTTGIGIGDTAILESFQRTGVEPGLGDFYYLTYDYQKTDFSTQLFTKFRTIEANFGTLSEGGAENALTLASYLAISNGAVLVGIKQVEKAPGGSDAPASSYIEAIDELRKPLPGNILPDVLVPLSTEESVYAALTTHCETLSGIRFRSERMGFIGFASGTEPTRANELASGIGSNRIVASYPDRAFVPITDELGKTTEVLVDGTFLASALVGSVVSPAFDVATPYTRRKLVGFSRLGRTLDAVEQNQVAVGGVTILEDAPPFLQVRQGLTTDFNNVLTRTPTVTQIRDFVQQGARTTLDPFIGTKFLNRRLQDIETALNQFLRANIEAEILAAYTGTSAEVDADDPTAARVESFYQPIFPLLYIIVSFFLRSRL
jgi:hypothetical protein